jgi:hypothetical protein
MSEYSDMTEGGFIFAGLLSIALAIVKSCSKKGMSCKTPCGSENNCFVSVHDENVFVKEEVFNSDGNHQKMEEGTIM